MIVHLFYIPANKGCHKAAYQNLICWILEYVNISMKGPDRLACVVLHVWKAIMDKKVVTNSISRKTIERQNYIVGLCVHVSIETL